MKISALAAAAAVCFVGFGGTVYAQQSPSSDNADVTWIGSRTPTSTENPATIRYEAQSVLRDARQNCHQESSAQNRKDCMRAAQEHYNDMMDSAHSSSGMQHRGSNR